MNSVPDFKPSLPINQLVLNVPRSATLAINETSKQLLLEGEDVVKLGLGQSPFPVPKPMVEALKAYASTKDYMAVQGYLPLREAIAGFISNTEQLDVDASQVLIGPGSKELFFGLQMVLDCDLLLPAPSWVSYQPQANLLGRRTTWLPCSSDENWKLNPATLDTHCQQHNGKPQLLVLNTPNNPSGACYSDSEIQALADVARRHELLVLSDEIYSELHFQGQHVSIARYYPEGTIISNGISKWAGAGGWRLGFFVVPETLRPILEAMIVVASETYTSVSAPVQMAAISAFEDSTDMLDYIHASRQAMRDIGLGFSSQLQAQGVRCVTPQGGFYALGEFESHREALLRHGITDGYQLSRRMLEATGVAALPGSDFGLGQSLTLRFAYVDFDGQSVLQQMLSAGTEKLDLDSSFLRHLFSAPQRIGDWLRSLE